ncbi:hypothetical protein CLOM_g8205 [Closterium sp. NIES-68]|nr:hypothetical protein CLOM_g8205 [Closterium sp. NIES-68]GJP66111.1 hypothetical protein CLOP_g23028 [Closterium sp. NIES-67]
MDHDMMDHDMSGMGHDTNAMGHNMTAVGHNMTAMGHNMMAVDHNMTAVGHNMTAVGHNMTAVGHNMTAVGHNMTAIAHNMSGSTPTTSMSMTGDGGICTGGACGGGASGDGSASMSTMAMTPTTGTMASTGMTQMWLYWGPTVTILFENWRTSEWAVYIFACFAVLAFCVLHEFLTSLRLKLSQAASGRCRVNDVEQGAKGGASKTSRDWHPLLDRLAATGIYTLNTTFSYTIMLIIMSFNIGLFIAVVLGLSIGFFLFGSKRQGNSPNNQEFQKVQEQNYCETSGDCCAAP